MRLTTEQIRFLEQYLRRNVTVTVVSSVVFYRDVRPFSEANKELSNFSSEELGEVDDLMEEFSINGREISSYAAHALLGESHFSSDSVYELEEAFNVMGTTIQEVLSQMDK
ncbi:hypothetical protein [Lactococcus protaetiae]|uniref:Uncharacterized protein n=1 Tax=Lactococcus protaetiae TaxID=2592653 RepID=A0A514Z730_9LACT|nr:hypothetical protein [Lactococcus protaetiae]QDK70400.1 hypothetical protein FLP15_03460 [Lactococcus protaetiae]